MAIIDNIQAAKDAVINNDGIKRTTAALSSATNAAIDSLANFEIDNLNNQGLSFDAFGDVVNTAGNALNNLADVAGDLSKASDSVQNQINKSTAVNQVDNNTVSQTVLTVNQNSVANINTANASQMLGTANRLHSYASYTYRLSLFLLSKEDYKTISDSPESFTPRNALISGAGKDVASTDSGSRHPEFKDDFYFEDLRIQTMVGMNAGSKASNALDFNFTIVEPYGMTFLDRLLIATKGVGSKNYTDMPYLLQIEFFGHKDDGTTNFLPIPGTLKRFPIRLVAMGIEVTTNGATYKCTATPYNMGAFDDKIATAGVNLQVNGNTVEKFFNAPGVAKVGQAIEDQRFDADGKPTKTRSNTQVSVDSLTAGLNGWFEYQKTEGAREFPDEILFNIDEKIAKSKILREGIVAPGKTQMSKPGTTEGSKVAGGAAIGGDPNRKDWIINAGTTIQSIVDTVIRSSDYVHKQIADPNDPKWAGKSGEDIAKELEKTLEWYKVIPSIELLEFDDKANRFAKRITYHIKTYTVYDSKHPLGPSKKPTTWHKEYNYLYTGQNVDILDFKIDFNALFFSLLSINRSSQQTSTVNAAGKKESTKIDLPTKHKGDNNIQGTQTEIKASSGNAESKTQTIDDIQKTLYSNSKADMINITLDIVGDPDFIKQDDVYINPSQGTYDSNTKTTNNQIGGNGSLVMDRGEVFAKVKFRTPVDRSLETGLLREDGRYRESSFSGVYRVLGVMNMFGQGQFKQNVDMIRCYDLSEKEGGSISGERIKDSPQTTKNKQPPVITKKLTNVGNNQSIRAELITTPTVTGNQSNLKQQVLQASGGGLGTLSDSIADAAAAFSGGPLDLGKAVSGAIDELSGAVGLRLPPADINALVSSGSDIVQSGLNLANSFAEGVGVTGAQLDLAQIANNANEFASLAEERIRRSTNGGIDNSNSIFT